MKKTKTLAAFLLSLTLLTPLFACSKESLDLPSSDISSSEEFSADSSSSLDSSSETEEEGSGLSGQDNLDTPDYGPFVRV